MPATKNTNAAKEIAADIMNRAAQNLGTMWGRMNGEGRLVECRALLCTEMLKDAVRPLPMTMEMWTAVHGHIVCEMFPSA